MHNWCAGDFSQGLLPSTGAPGIVVPMVRICMPKQSLAQLCVMPLYNLHTLRCKMQMHVMLITFRSLVLACSIIYCWKHPLWCTAQHSTTHIYNTDFTRPPSLGMISIMSLALLHGTGTHSLTACRAFTPLWEPQLLYRSGLAPLMSPHSYRLHTHMSR